MPMEKVEIFCPHRMLADQLNMNMDMWLVVRLVEVRDWMYGISETRTRTW